MKGFNSAPLHALQELYKLPLQGNKRSKSPGKGKKPTKFA